ncbi:CubicO group peptidase (beta-lactamase class C family) [Ereboglobus sp. PH5-5]|nr:CubicO group peptidase (beta-lactamase class C family) [Ereboglobus sp. PH5-5]
MNLKIMLLGILVVFATAITRAAPSMKSVHLTPTVLPQVAPAEVGLDSAVLDRIDVECQKGIDEELVPGCVVCVGRHGKITWLKAYGNRRLATKDRPAHPMTVDTVFDLASITKPVAVAASIMTLVDQGKLNVDDKVARYLDEYKTPEKETITIRQLLTHTSGLGGLHIVRTDQLLAKTFSQSARISGPRPAPPAELPTAPRDEVVRLLAAPPVAKPGEVYFYSGANMDTLAVLLERVTGRDLATYARENIFQPLGMLETDYLPGVELRRRAAPTRLDGRDTGRVRDPYTIAKGGVSGGAGLFSTADDLAVFSAMMLNRGRLPEHLGRDARILNPETVALMTTRGAGAASDRALGWVMGAPYAKNMSDVSYGHGGFDGNYIQLDPKHDIFVIFLSNRMHIRKGAAKASRVPVYQLAGRIGDIAVDAITAPQSGTGGKP